MKRPIPDLTPAEANDTMALVKATARTKEKKSVKSEGIKKRKGKIATKKPTPPSKKLCVQPTRRSLRLERLAGSSESVGKPKLVKVAISKGSKERNPELNPSRMIEDADDEEHTGNLDRDFGEGDQEGLATLREDSSSPQSMSADEEKDWETGSGAEEDSDDEQELVANDDEQDEETNSNGEHEEEDQETNIDDEEDQETNIDDEEVEETNIDDEEGEEEEVTDDEEGEEEEVTGSNHDEEEDDVAQAGPSSAIKFIPASFKVGTAYYNTSLETLIAQGQRVGLAIKPEQIGTKKKFDQMNKKVLKLKEANREVEIKTILNNGMEKLSDNSEPERAYKILFKDGSVEWCKASEVEAGAIIAVNIYKHFRLTRHNIPDIWIIK